jgi:hypothetical protein
MIIASLTAPARSFAPLASLHQENRANNQNGRTYETKWLQREAEEVKHQQVAEAHGEGGNDNDEE